MQYGMPHGVLRTQFAFSLTDKVRNPVTWAHAITVRCCRKPVANAGNRLLDRGTVVGTL